MSVRAFGQRAVSRVSYPVFLVRGHGEGAERDVRASRAGFSRVPYPESRIPCFLSGGTARGLATVRASLLRSRFFPLAQARVGCQFEVEAA
jgi:hypothetical protein